MCGCIGNCILARDPIRPNSAWKALGVIGPSRSDIKTCEDSPCSRCRSRVSLSAIGFFGLTRKATSAAAGTTSCSNSSCYTGAALLGQVGLDWQLGGFAVDPPTAPAGGSDGSTSQLVQAMAGFTDSSGAGESLNTAPLGADTSQQTLLTAPQHA